MTELALRCCAQAFFNSDEQDLVSSCDERTSQANGFSCCSTWTLRASRLQLLWLVVSVVALRHVESSWIRDQTHVLCNGRWILNHWTTRKSQIFSFSLWYIPLYCCNCSVTKLYSTLCDLMDYSMPGPISLSLSGLCLMNQWCHPTISSSVTLFSFCLQSFTASGSFPVSQLFASGGQSIGASASTSVLPMNIQGWFPLRLTDLISLFSKELSWIFSSTTVQ